MTPSIFACINFFVPGSYNAGVPLILFISAADNGQSNESKSFSRSLLFFWAAATPPPPDFPVVFSSFGSIFEGLAI
jgi:hypothetical protein